MRFIVKTVIESNSPYLQTSLVAPSKTLSYNLDFQSAVAYEIITRMSYHDIYMEHKVDTIVTIKQYNFVFNKRL